jgi:hypothetical protein
MPPVASSFNDVRISGLSAFGFPLSKKWKYEIVLDLPFIILDLVYKVQMIFFRGTSATERKTKCGQTGYTDIVKA